MFGSGTRNTTTRNLTKCESFVGAILHIFTACITMLGGMTTAVMKKPTRDSSTSGGGVGEANGPLLNMRTSRNMMTSFTLTIMTMALNTGGTTSPSAGIRAGP